MTSGTPPTPKGPSPKGPSPEGLSPEGEQTRARVRDALQQEVSRVDTPEAAEAVAERIERMAAGSTEFEREQQARNASAGPGEAVQRVAEGPGGADETAATLLKAAEEIIPRTPESAAALQGALDVMKPGTEPRPPEVERGRTLLKDAVLHRMGPLQRLDARIYLALNGFPHAPWSDRLGTHVTFWTTGGWIWAGCLLVARLLGVRGTRGALSYVLPSVVAATWIVEHPIKAVFRRRRPFVDIVRALVVGKKPGSWSFPSGHTASSFASAWMLAKIWRRQSPLFFTVASLVGCSRVYVGAHYPGDVTIGALCGIGLAELTYRLNRLIRSRLD